jgi:hypothetical protein
MEIKIRKERKRMVQDPDCKVDFHPWEARVNHFLFTIVLSAKEVLFQAAPAGKIFSIYCAIPLKNTVIIHFG